MLARNARTSFGEVDILVEAPDRRTIVVVEVKTRTARAGESDRRPEAQITPKKSKKLIRLLDALVRSNGWEDRPRRIDVVAIDWPTTRGGKPVIRHYENAVAARR